MSRRTSEANNAVNNAWIKERGLVRIGKGTRNWTPREQRDILDKLRPQDCSGKAYHGHHMKSVAVYPMYQGDAANIQFLTIKEHREAHGGNFHNSTNGCYDPRTRSTRDFGKNKYEPRQIIVLSEPVGIANEILHGTPKSSETFQDKIEETTGKKEKGEFRIFSKNFFKYLVEGFIGAATDTMAEKVGEQIGGKIAGAIFSNNGSRGTGNSSDSFTYDSSSFDEYGDLSAERNYPDDRDSPYEHDVSGYDRQQNGKTVHVNPYKRGGNNVQ